MVCSPDTAPSTVRVPEDDCASCRVHWQDPYNGECADSFILSADGDEMTQLTEMYFPETQKLIRYR